jgi:uncharacterized hydantoinase/oxoprolinase family protein
MQILGLDLGNAKLKLCLIRFQGDLESSEIVWASQPLPLTSDRRDDFESGIPLALMSFCLKNSLKLSEIAGVAVCSSHSYSYDRFHESVDHLVEILGKVFKQCPVFLVSALGTLTPIEAIQALAPAEKYRYVLTNFVGSATLATRQIQNGLSIDLGTTTLDIIPIVNGQIDPVGLQDPDGYLRFRYSQNRIHWLGLTIVPLHSLCERVELSTGSFQIVPRHYRTDLIFALLAESAESAENDPTLFEEHAYGQSFPSPERARNQLCQLIGLDPFLVSEAEILELRDLLYARLRDKAAAAIQAVTRDCFGGVKPELEVAVYALGESLLARPALLQAGFEACQLRGLALKRETGLWSASSVFAMALLALERLTGQRFELEGTAL